MSTVSDEIVLFTIPDGSVLQPKVNEIVVAQATFDNINVNTINSQTISGSVQTDDITEPFPGAGVTIDSVRIAEDNIVLPAMTLASVKSVGVDTNITMAIIPKGTGAIIANVPSNSADGGNMRGNYAIDLQRVRGDGGQVASGNYSVIIGGNSNTASGQYSAIGGGLACSAQGDYSFAQGRRAKATLPGTFVISDSTDADFSATNSNQFSARYTQGFRFISELMTLNENLKYYSMGNVVQTTDANPTVIYSFTAPANSVCIYSVDVVATTPTGVSQIIQASVKVKNISGTAIVGQKFNYWDDPEPALVNTRIEFVGVGNSVQVTAYGVAATTIRWRCNIRESSVATL